MATTGPESPDPKEKVTEVLQFSVERSLWPDLLQKDREATKTPLQMQDMWFYCKFQPPMSFTLRIWNRLRSRIQQEITSI